MKAYNLNLINRMSNQDIYIYLKHLLSKEIEFDNYRRRMIASHLISQITDKYLLNIIIRFLNRYNFIDRITIDEVILQYDLKVDDTNTISFLYGVLLEYKTLHLYISNKIGVLKFDLDKENNIVHHNLEHLNNELLIKGFISINNHIKGNIQPKEKINTYKKIISSLSEADFKHNTQALSKQIEFLEIQKNNFIYDVKQDIWFKVGLCFAKGEAQKLYHKYKFKKGTFIKITLELGFKKTDRPYFSETFNNDIKRTSSSHNIYSKFDKLDTIYKYCIKNKIQMVDSFIDVYNKMKQKQ